MATQQDQLAALNVRWARFNNGIFLFRRRVVVVQECGELRVAPDGGEVEAVRVELLDHVHIPLEVQFTDAVVGNRQCLGARVSNESRSSRCIAIR